MSPIVITYILFLLYVSTGGEHFTVKKVYSIMAILNLSRLPMMVFPLSRASLEEGLTSFERIRKFLMMPEMKLLQAPEPFLSDVHDTALQHHSRDGDKSVGNPLLPVALSTREEDEEEVAEDCIHGAHADLDGDIMHKRRCKDDDSIVVLENCSFAWVEPEEDMSPNNNQSDALRNGYDGKGLYFKGKSVLGNVAMTTMSPMTASGESSVNEGCKLALRNVSLSISRGELVAVVGSVGAGKTTLLHAIMGLLHRSKGNQYVGGAIGYAGQQYFVQSKSLQENVQFDDKFDENRYADALDCSELSGDLLQLPNADLTHIGEKGIALSGGQKARVNIARMLYARDIDIYVFDDQLAAVDVVVGKSIFANAILGALKEKTRVVALSSNYHLLRHFHRIIEVVDGNVTSFASYQEFLSACPQYMNNGMKFAVDADEDMAPIVSIADPITLRKVSNSDRVSVYWRDIDKIIIQRNANPGAKGESVEDREVGRVSLDTFVKYFSGSLGPNSKMNGYHISAIIFVNFFVGQAFRVLTDMWIGFWATDATAGYDQHSKHWYMNMYSIFVCITILLMFARAFYLIQFSVQASETIHKKAIGRVLNASINMYFDITPLGRILNRLSKDLDSVDSQLPDSFLSTLQNGFHMVSVVLLCVVSIPYIIVLLIPLGYLFYLIQQYFRNTSRELKRLDGVSRSPVFGLFAETIDGLPYIRAYRRQNVFMKKLCHLVDENTRPIFTNQIVSRWLSLRLDMISALIVFFVALFAVILTDYGVAIDRNVLGLSLVYSIQLSGMLQWTVRTVIDTENGMTSVERIYALTSIPIEACKSEQDKVVDKEWPSKGEISIANLRMKYRPNLPLVLDGVNLDISAGSKVGICGRTGSGKSSLILALLRIVEAEVGSVISVDGCNISEISLETLRRHLTVIPQGTCTR